MTEPEWLASSDPKAMLQFLLDGRGRHWEPDALRLRRLAAPRMLACLCARHLWEYMPLGCRRAVAAAEGYSRRKAGVADLVAASNAVMDSWRPPWRELEVPERMAVLCCEPLPAAIAENWFFDDPPDREQASMLRDLVDPFWVAPLLYPCDGTARSVAAEAHDSGDFSCLPVAADALEESGCSDLRLLSHLRSGGPHFRGCWACDVLRGAYDRG